jgi:hypothetical protein
VRSTPRRNLLGLVAVAVALPLGVSACSSSTTTDESTTTTRPSGVVGADSACAIVSPAQILAVLHHDVGEPHVKNSTATTICTYPSKDDSAPQDEVIIGYRGGVTTAEAATEQAAVAKLHATSTDLTGTGGQTYYYTVGTGAHAATTLVSLVGETQVTVTSTASAEDAGSLATLIFNTFAADATTTTTAPTTSSTAAG